MAHLSDKPYIVVIGGGTGSFTLLSALKKQTPHITALVNMADDGGSTGVLRDELGVLPPGDIRQCLVALGESSQALRDLFNYRFPPQTSLGGHSFGNLFLSAVEMMSDDFGEAVELASKVLQITGKVLPITLTNCNLVLQIGKRRIKGQYEIAHMKLPKNTRPKLSLEPRAKLNPAAEAAIKQANMVIIAPGNLYGSLVPTLLVDGVAEALQTTQAKVMYVCNLVNKPVQTKDFAVHDYANEIERFVGADTLDAVLYNIDQPTKTLLEKYALEGEYPVNIDEAELKRASYVAISGKFLATNPQKPSENDIRIARSLIRHDPLTLTKVLMELI